MLSRNKLKNAKNPPQWNDGKAPVHREPDLTSSINASCKKILESQIRKERHIKALLALHLDVGFPDNACLNVRHVVGTGEFRSELLIHLAAVREVCFVPNLLIAIQSIPQIIKIQFQKKTYQHPRNVRVRSELLNF